MNEFRSLLNVVFVNQLISNLEKLKYQNSGLTSAGLLQFRVLYFLAFSLYQHFMHQLYCRVAVALQLKQIKENEVSFLAVSYTINATTRSNGACMLWNIDSH